MRNTSLLIATTAATGALACLALSQSITTNDSFNNSTNLYPVSSSKRFNTTRTKYPRDLSFADPTLGNASATSGHYYQDDDSGYQYQKIQDSPLAHGHRKKLMMLSKTESGHYVYNNITLKVCTLTAMNVINLCFLTQLTVSINSLCSLAGTC